MMTQQAATYFNQRPAQYTPQRAASAPAPTKVAGLPASKLSAVAKRPTFAAASTLPITMRLQAMGPRASNRNRSVLEMLRQIRDYSPDASKAVENILTLANPGYDLNVFFAKKQNEGGEPVQDEEGMRLLQEIATRMFSEYSGAWDELTGKQDTYPGLDTAIGMINLTVFTQGAAAMEVELTEALDDVVDFYPVDPSIIDFQLNIDTLRLVPGLMLQGPFTPLDLNRFRYIGKDCDVNQPGGRSPMMPLLDTIFFQQQFMRELQAITHMVNMPRLDIKVLHEMAEDIVQRVRPDLVEAGQEEARSAYLGQFISELEDTINNLEADDAFIHFDAVEVEYKQPGGVAIPVKDVMDALDKMIISAVKQLPILLGRNEGATTTHATVQWQVFVRQLGGYQRISKALITWAFNLYLRMKGRQSYVTLEFKKHKTTDELVDAQTLNVKSLTWGYMISQGWADGDEAAMDLLKHKAVGAPIPAAGAADSSVEADVSAASKEEGRGGAWPDWLLNIHRDTAAATARTQPDTGLRAVHEKTASYPAWLQRIHHDAAQTYSAWRAMAILPRFQQAASDAHHASAALDKMSEVEIHSWLYDRLKLDEHDRAHLTDRLVTIAHSGGKAAIEEMLRACGKHQTVDLTNARLLKDLDTRARDGAWSIVETYNGDLAAAIGKEQILERGLTEIIGKVRDAIGRLSSWEAARNLWKQAQVAMTEIQDAVSRAIQEFVKRNKVVGEAEVYPYDSTRDVCADYISRNPYPDMETALSETVLPAHQLCPHYVRLVNGGTIEGDIWAGGE